jgi:DNA topoisomerase-6 subunit B
MAPSSNKQGGGGGGEIQVSKSPAEFFAENQAIAGFDNMGKALYTSIRELVENSLDACESIGELPSIKVEIQELCQQEFNKLRGISSSTKDVELFQSKNKKDDVNPAGVSKDNGDSAKKPRRKASQESYFIIKVRDNGCGMRHESIPDLLGRVLSGSKYGVRQTRGKFGLGAKMALIWSKKSTGVPIRITTAHRPKGGAPPSQMSVCVLDIDITKNVPRIVEHKKQANKNNWVGTELEILIAGNWTTYKARIVQYLQQLAIITPYAQLELTYEIPSEPQRKNVSIRYDRRSDQMPPPAKEVKHHPSSVNNLVIHQLLERTKCKTLTKFLATELSSVSVSLANRIVAECGWDDGMEVELNGRQITKLVQTLRSVKLFKAPDGNCLSPLGEYNDDDVFLHSCPRIFAHTLFNFVASHVLHRPI